MNAYASYGVVAENHIGKYIESMNLLGKEKITVKNKQVDTLSDSDSSSNDNSSSNDKK